MDASSLATGLSGLRRELEEILALVGETRGSEVDDSVQSSSSPNRIEADPDHDPVEEIKQVDSLPETAHDPMLDDALVVITEFGQATPAMLQMWLSIDYARAVRILNGFKAQGLVSAKGRVRHKAYDLRRRAP